MKLLMEADAICPGDGMNMVRVWMIQAQVVVNYFSNKDGNQPGMGGIGGGLPGGSSSGGGGKLASISHAVTSASTALAGAASTAAGTKDAASTTSQSTETTTASSTAEQASTTASSSWFGGYFSGSSAAAAPSAPSVESKMTPVVTTKSAVSSSHGQAGLGHLSSKDLEKAALDILSCILQLLELRDLPVPNEQWIQSVTICCLLYLPFRQNVRQAAHSTLPQVLTLLVKDKNASSLTMKTWDDLLTCALGFSSSKSNGNSSSDKRTALQGVFSHCRIGEKDAAQPPSSALSLELMATLLEESPDVFSGVGQKTFGVIVQVLQTQSRINSNAMPLDYLKALQFALIVLQTQGNDWPAECRELIGRLIQPITLATEAIRKQPEFEDGFVYKVPNKQIPTTTSSNSKIETLHGLPPTVLWKAALSMETVKALVQEKTNRDLWLHEEVVGHLLEATSDFCTIGASCEDHMNLLVRACRKQGESTTSLAYSAETIDSIERWKKGKTNADAYVLGESLWAGFTALLKMIEQLDESVLEQSFAPSMAVLQHFLKRFPANGIIVQRSLEGYFSLAKVSLSVPLLRGALMASLCKLSLPHWGSNDPSTLLKDHNIAALICILNIVHRYHDKIGSEWSLVLQTFEELSSMSIASPELSDRAYVGALSISAVYSRFASFSASLSDESLIHFMSGLKEVAISEKFSPAIPSPVGGAAIRRADNATDISEEQSGIGNKIMNMGARAMTWKNDGNIQQEDVPVAERTKNNYYDEYRAKFANRLESSRHPVRNSDVSFSIALMADAAMCNAFRHGRSGATIFDVLCSAALESSSARLFFMDIVATMIISHVAEEDSIPASFKGPATILYNDPRQNQYLAVDKETSIGSNEEIISQVDLLSPLCKLIAGAKSTDVAEVGLEALYAILESTGHKLRNDAWKQVIDAIASVPTAEHSASEWVDCCQLGFRCLKLIVDDFLDDAATAARTALLDCCSTFGSSRHDVNTSLTAIGLLWSIADQDAGKTSVERALEKLVLLSRDPRPEVRNCSVNTLFSCIVGRGPKFSEKEWESCICSTIFGVYDAVTMDTEVNDAATAEAPNKTKSRYRVSVHHSRDSSDKQWLATQALVLRGLSRLLRNFFSALMNTTDNGSVPVRREDDETPWFDKAWNKILGYAYDASIQAGGRDTLDLRNAGVELLVLCNQLSCAAGVQAAITPARVGTNMEVINGALRSVRTPEKPENASALRHSHSAVTEIWRENMFLDAFDVLDSYREHLDNNSDETEATQVQVLSNLAAELGKLYECCKDHEFKEDLSLSTYESFETILIPLERSPKEDDTMVLRFVRIVTTVATASYSGPGSRFLSQAQRSCMDVLKTMIANGSPEAIVDLTLLADSTFFAERESDGKPKKGTDILEHEAVNILVGSISNANVSHESRVVALVRLLSIFLECDMVKAKKKTGDATGLSYKNLIPFMAEGLLSARALEQKNQQGESQAITGLLNSLWEKVFMSFALMLSPTTNKSKQVVIPHAPDLAALIHATANNVPKRHSSELDSILGSGATACLEIARTENTSVETKDETLNLFGACFAGSCKTDETMQDMGKTLIESCIKSLSSKPPEIDVNVQATLKICQALQQAEDIEGAVIAIFAELSRLMGLEETSVRKAAAAVLAKANLGQVLDDKQAQCEAAEERARAAERRVSELEAEMEVLQKQNEALERQLGLL
ncbi:MAG: hypothetical protein SGILL_004729 [Bacillariaceae sp.]